MTTLANSCHDSPRRLRSPLSGGGWLVGPVRCGVSRGFDMGAELRTATEFALEWQVPENQYCSEDHGGQPDDHPKRIREGAVCSTGTVRRVGPERP